MKSKFIFIIIILAFCILPIVSGMDWTDLLAYYKLDETSGTVVIDSLGTNNMTNFGATINTTGKIGAAYNFSTDTHANITGFSFGQAFSWSGWVKMNFVPTEYCFFVHEGTGVYSNPLSFIIFGVDWGGPAWGVYIGRESPIEFDIASYVAPINAGQWYYYVMTYNGTSIKIYINGTSVTNESTSQVTASGGTFWLNRRSDGYGCSLVMDEVAIFNRSITQTEVSELWNNGNGLTFTPPTPPIAYQGINPVDSYNSSSQTIIFDMKCMDDAGVSYVQLWGNWSGTWKANYTNTSYTNNTWINVTVTGIPNGRYRWAVWCNDTVGWTNITQNRTLTVDTTAPSAYQGTNPINNYNSTSSTVIFDMKCTDDVAVHTIQLWTNTTGTWHTNYSNSSYTNNTWLNVSVSGIAAGKNYKWAVWCNDTVSLTNMTDNRTFNIEAYSFYLAGKINGEYTGGNKYTSLDGGSTWISNNTDYLFEVLLASESVILELGAQVNVTAQLPGAEAVCIDIDHPEYGINYSCNNSGDIIVFPFNISYFRKTTFNDSTVFKNLTYLNGGNQTIYIKAHQYDEINNFTMNFTGYETGGTFPTYVRVYINDTFSNNLGTLFTGYFDINAFNDTSIIKNITFPEAGTQLVYFRLPKFVTVNSAYLNVSGYINYINSTKFPERNIKNPDFERTGENWTFSANNANFKGNYTSEWKTSGAQSYKITATPGWYDNDRAYITQTVNFSTIDDLHITFRYGKNDTAYSYWYKYLKIGDDIYFYGRIVANDTIESIWLNTTNITGLKEIQMYLDYISLVNRRYDYWWFYIDNIVEGQYTYPINSSFEIGLIDGIKEWNYTGALNITNDKTANFNESLMAYLSICTADSDGYCTVPLYLTSSSAGIIQLSAINITYSGYAPNPVSLNKTLIENFLNNSINFTNIPITIQTSQNGTIYINDVRFDYAGGNSTINFTIWNASNSSYNESTGIDMYYSNWKYAFPKNVNYLEFIPATSKSKNVTPYGQTSTIAILNITALNYGSKNMNFSIYLNGTSSCVNLTASVTNNKSQGFLLDNSWKDIFTNLTYLNVSRIWLWADYNCSYNEWRLWYPELFFKGCCIDCVCSEDLE